MKHVLVTGGTGFIGSRLALYWREQGHSVAVLGQTNTPAEEENKQLLEQKGVDVTLAGVDRTDELRSCAKASDFIYHLAAAQHEANVPDQHFRDVNVEGTRRLLEACSGDRVQRFVHGSTIGVYGPVEGVVDEESPTNPNDIYGVTKLEGERLVLSYRDKIPLSVVRISETYGPGDRRLLKLFRAIHRNVFFMIGNGKNLHHLVYIDDLIKGMVLAGEADEAEGDIFLLAGSRPLTTREMVDTIAAAVDKRPPRLSVPMLPFAAAAHVMQAVLRPLGIQPPIHPRRLDFFRKSFVLSGDKAKQKLGYIPSVDFETGSARTAHWYRERGLL